MPVVKSTSRELDRLARLMRAEVESDGDLGMLMVGNVSANQVLGDYLAFRDKIIERMFFKVPVVLKQYNQKLL